MHWLPIFSAMSQTTTGRVTAAEFTASRRLGSRRTVERVQARIGLTQLRAGSSLIDIVGVDGQLGRLGGAAPGVEGRNLDHFCLTVRGFDLERVKAHLTAHGVALG